MYRCMECSNQYNFQQDLRTHRSLAHKEQRGTEFLQDPDSRDELVHADQSSDEESSDNMLRVKELKEAIVPLRERMRRWPEVREMLEDDSSLWLLGSGRRLRGGCARHWDGLTSLVERVALWNYLLKGVEGKFGSGVFHFFKFFKEKIQLYF